MNHNVDFQLASSEQVEAAIGARLEAIRLSQNITQAQLAERAGVSRSTVARLAQPTKGISLDSFIRIMRALGLADHLQTLLPDPSISPLERVQQQRQPRQRARPDTKSAAGSEVREQRWEWNDGESDE